MFSWLLFLNVNTVLFAVHKHSPSSYLLCQNEPQRGHIEHCLCNRTKIFGNNKAFRWMYNENKLKEVIPNESIFKKYRPHSVWILPAFRGENINIVYWLKKHCSKFMIIVGRGAGSLKTWEILNCYRTDLYSSFHIIMNTFYEANKCPSKK